MQGSLPEGLEEVDPRRRAFPKSWKDAAIRVLYDTTIGGVQCQVCGRLSQGRSALRALHADHVIPFARGGPTSWENMQLACPECNWNKSSYST